MTNLTLSCVHGNFVISFHNVFKCPLVYAHLYVCTGYSQLCVTVKDEAPSESENVNFTKLVSVSKINIKEKQLMCSTGPQMFSYHIKSDKTCNSKKVSS